MEAEKSCGCDSVGPAPGEEEEATAEIMKVGCAVVGFIRTCQQRDGRRRRMEFVGGGNGDPCGIVIVGPVSGEL